MHKSPKPVGNVMLVWLMLVVVLQSNTVTERYIGSVLLERRSLFLMSDDMYTNFMHGIREQISDTMDENILNLDMCSPQIGDIIERDTRISFTVRHVPKVLKNKISLFGKR